LNEKRQIPRQKDEFRGKFRGSNSADQIPRQKPKFRGIPRAAENCGPIYHFLPPFALPNILVCPTNISDKSTPVGPLFFFLYYMLKKLLAARKGVEIAPCPPT